MVCGVAEPVLQGEVVDLEDDAVGLVVELVAGRGERLEDPLPRLPLADQIGRDGEAKRTQPLHLLRLRGHGRVALQVVGEEVEPVGLGLGRVFLLECPCGEVARIREGLGIAGAEGGDGHEGLAPHLDVGGRDLRWDAADHQHVGGHQLARLAVATGCREHQSAGSVVPQADGKAINLLGRDCRAFDACKPAVELLCGVALVEAEHGRAVANLVSGDGRRGHARQHRRIRVSCRELTHEQVELRVCNLGFVELPVLPVVLNDRGLEFRVGQRRDLELVERHQATEGEAESP